MRRPDGPGLLPAPASETARGDTGSAVRGLCCALSTATSLIPSCWREERICSWKEKPIFLVVPAVFCGRGPVQAEAPGPGAAVRCGAVLPKRLKGVLPTGHLLANTPHQYTGLAKRATQRWLQILPCFLCACFSAWGDYWAAEARCRPSTTPVRYRPGWKLCVVWLILSSSPSPHRSFYFCLENLFVKLEVVLTKSVAGQNTGGKVFNILADAKENRSAWLRPN